MRERAGWMCGESGRDQDSVCIFPGRWEVMEGGE